MCSDVMRIHDPQAYQIAGELELIQARLPLGGARLLELGCGAAWMTRLLAERFAPAYLLATEVDAIQHAQNLRLTVPPQVAFRYGGAEAIDAPDQSFDGVFMFKSLHHVPPERMDQALTEIHRVLRPGGFAWFAEPVYWGDFNALLSLVHDEREVRQRAFETLRAVVARGLFHLEEEFFYQVPGSYASWEQFEDRFLRVTHTDLQLTPERYARIRDAFMAHLTDSGAHFLKPHRVDLLRRPPAT